MPSPALDQLTTAYLRRLGVDAEPVGVGALARLHRAHVERIPYETFWIHLGERWGIEQTESMRRIAEQQRGGYCFHLNGALVELLRALGYYATLHVAGVHDHNGPAAETMGNHVAVIVHDLPTNANQGGRWYLDAGLGDVLHEPIALLDGASTQFPGTFRLERSAHGPGDWHFDAGASGSLGGVSISTRPVSIASFGARHHFNARSPQSSFARTVTAQRRHRCGSDVLRGCVLTSVDDGATSTTHLETRAEWLEVLADLFSLRLTHAASITQDQVDALWSTVRANHAAWLDRQAADACDVAAAA